MMFTWRREKMSMIDACMVIEEKRFVAPLKLDDT